MAPLQYSICFVVLLDFVKINFVGLQIQKWLDNFTLPLSFFFFLIISNEKKVDILRNESNSKAISNMDNPCFCNIGGNCFSECGFYTYAQSTHLASENKQVKIVIYSTKKLHCFTVLLILMCFLDIGVLFVEKK